MTFANIRRENMWMSAKIRNKSDSGTKIEFIVTIRKILCGLKKRGYFITYDRKY
jgi:hypothetical protein